MADPVWYKITTEQKGDTQSMEFAVTLEKKEISVIGWMLKNRTKTHIIEGCKGLVLGLIVLAVTVYNIFFYEEKTTAQVVILVMLTVLCFGRMTLAWMKMINYEAIAERKNKSVKGKTAYYSFTEEGVTCSSENGSETIVWEDFTEWGEYNDCTFAMFKGGIVIILDHRKYEKENIEELKTLLRNKETLHTSL